jgi:hypothetical protein
MTEVIFNIIFGLILAGAAAMFLVSLALLVGALFDLLLYWLDKRSSDR